MHLVTQKTKISKPDAITITLTSVTVASRCFSRYKGRDGFTVKKAKKHILAWKAHLLRSINQDEVRLDTIKALNETSVFLVQDWAMKFIPRKFRESQKD